MTSRVDPILDLIDGALADPGQHSPESDLYVDVAPQMPPAGTCFRCTTHPVADGSEMCAGCRAYLLEDSDHDPCGITVTAGPNGPAIPLAGWEWREVGIYDEMHQWIEEPATVGRIYHPGRFRRHRSNVHALFVEALRHGQPQQLRLSSLDERKIGFLGDKLIRAHTVEVEQTSDPGGFLAWTPRPPSMLSTITHITIDGYRFLAHPDPEGVCMAYWHRERGRRTFTRLTATVTPVEDPPDTVTIVGYTGETWTLDLDANTGLTVPGSVVVRSGRQA